MCLQQYPAIMCETICGSSAEYSHMPHVDRWICHLALVVLAPMLLLLLLMMVPARMFTKTMTKMIPVFACHQCAMMTHRNTEMVKVRERQTDRQR